jgi:3-hydroxybutyryl-CoA dehydrogenase
VPFTVAIIGAGTMGAGIAQIALIAGHPVRIVDTDPAAIDGARQRIGQGIAAVATKRGLAGDQLNAAVNNVLSRLTVAADPGAAVDGAAIAFEAVAEDLATKQAIFRALDAASPTAILATNTSALSVAAIAGATTKPGRVVGLHFFNPVPSMALVEVVAAAATEPNAVAAVTRVVTGWGKTPVRSADTPGFIVNRINRPFTIEALRMIEEGLTTASRIDSSMKTIGFPMGPFELMDLIGNDVNFAVTKSVWEACFHDARFTPSVLQQEMVAAGFLGRKSGRGYFRYDPDAPKPMVQTEAPQPQPAHVGMAGEGPLIAGLRARLAAAGIAVATLPADASVGPAYMAVGDALLVPTDGRTATARAAESEQPNTVVYDLALDYATCPRLAIACADTCSPEAAAAAIGALQAAGLAVTRLQDVAGLVVMRTVAMLANEAADAVTQGIGSARDIDLAMRNGVNYPRGPLAWADAIGITHVCAVLQHLAVQYGERYRTAPLLARRCATGARIGA